MSEYIILGILLVIVTVSDTYFIKEFLKIAKQTEKNTRKN